MSGKPLSKRQKVTDDGTEDNLTITPTGNNNRVDSPNNTRTPRKLLGSTENRFFSQPVTGSSNLVIPTLLPPEIDKPSSRGREFKSYSQSPPRSPGRSPTRRLKLIELSPVKNSRIELQKLYDSKKLELKKERLFIHQLVLQDFKSYAGRQVVGPFHTSFSAVVGPNGSGKSNVIDSMLFVFGFRASKMRQDRLSDLIHKSEMFPDLKSCSVEVHFKWAIDQNDANAIIDEEKGDLVITRKAFKNNASKYYINNKESNYTEVTTLLRKEGIDLDHKRFLILQGEVENISQMKAKAEKENDDGLLEYLEDIIGTSKYKEELEKLSIEIEALNDLCLEKENRFNIVDREKESLESGKESALDFLSKEKQLVLEKSKLYQLQLSQHNLKLTNTLEKKTELSGKLADQNEQFEKTSNQIFVINGTIDSLKSELKTITVEEKTLQTKRRKLETQKVGTEELINDLNKKKDENNNKADELNQAIKTNTNEIEKLAIQQEELSCELEEISKQYGLEKQKLEDIKLKLREKTEKYSNEITNHEKELMPWNTQLQQKKKEIKVVESEISMVQENRNKILDEIEVLRKDINEAEENCKITEEKITSLRDQKSKTIKEINIGESECEKAQQSLGIIKQKVESLRQKALEMRSSLSVTENKNKVLAALTRMQKSGRLDGFHGRLGDLAIIDEKYDIAISTACPRLDDLVVETVETGQKCIEYLRKNNLGYARFILLDKLRQFNLKNIYTPENVPRLFDLIKVKDPKFLNAFYSVLRDTLVSENMAQANRVAYGKQRFRVVTLDGKLIDISGTMTGGGKTVSRGLMKLKNANNLSDTFYSSEEVAAVENELHNKDKHYKNALEAYHEMEEELRRLKDRNPEIDIEITKREMDIDTMQNDISIRKRSLKELIEKQTNNSKNDDAVEILESKLDSLKAEYKTIEGQTKATKIKIVELKNKIMEIGGEELQNQNNLVSDISRKIEDNTKLLKKTKSQKLKKESLMRKLKKEVEEIIKESENRSINLERSKNEFEKINSELQDIVNEITEITSLKSVKEEQLEQVEQEKNSIEAEQNSNKAASVDIKNKLEKICSLEEHIKRDIDKVNQKMCSLEIRNVTQLLSSIEENDNESISTEQNNHAPIISNPDEIMEDKDTIIAATSDRKMDNNISKEDTRNNDEKYDKMDIDLQDTFIAPGIPRLSPQSLQSLDIEQLEINIGQLEDFVSNSNANIDILEEYALRLLEYKKRKSELNDVVKERDAVKDKLESLKARRYNEFMEGFNIISMTLKEMYQMITLGGNAELELVDSLDPFSEGVTFSVMPPKKSWRNISNLSGGEKTLSSLALVFALHKYKPTPLYVMDEIDAALDFRNVSIVANYIKERTKNAQFIVISLRNNMFELAKQLVGIYKRENKTQSAAVVNRELLVSE
ncbi:Structural maintenance of chromosomes protein 4 [Nakaseomyces bracarensis]|uniref:Structural maintenance of chromosomes protein n=1 Tax=Nakaseomyces bracarensis TaxID=273131 RepID=A0ABR4NXB9_9SACH